MRRLDWRRHRLLIQILAVALVALVAWTLVEHLNRPPPAAGQPPQVVTVFSVVATDTPIVRRGIGQVQAYNTTSVKSRVDGNITAVAYREGQQVEPGDLLIQLDPRPFQVALEQATAAIARDRAQLANARRDFQRYSALLRPGLVTQQTYDAQDTLIRQLEATLLLDQAQIDQARLNLDYAAIKAPFHARTGVRLVDVGNLVRATDQNALVVLTQLQPVFVNFTLPERYIDEVRSALRAGPVEVTAFDADDHSPVARGHLSVIDNTVDPASGMFRLKAEYANADEALWPGAFVNAHVVVAVHAQALNVPAIAIQQGPDGQYVFRLTPRGTVQMVPVEVGQIENDRALIDKGLRAGDRIVVDGAYGLSNGAQVSVRQLATAPANQTPTRHTPPVPHSPTPSSTGREHLDTIY